MSENKTQKTNQSVEEFLNSIKDEQKRKDSFELLELFKKVTKDTPKMWGESIVGFVDYHYKYASGREGDWFKVGFSPRKQNLTLYLAYDIDKYKEELKELGKNKTGRACLYINSLSDINIKVLEDLIKKSLK